MPPDHDDDEGPPGTQDDLQEEGHASLNDSAELLGASDVDSNWDLVTLSELTARLELTARFDVGNEQVSTKNGDISSTNPSIEEATAANPSQDSEESLWEPVSSFEHTARLDAGNEQASTNYSDIGSINLSIETSTAANPSQYFEESQVCGSTSKTARGEGVEGLKPTDTSPHARQYESQVDPSIIEGAIADALGWIRMDTSAYSRQLESPPAWIHIDNQATRTTDWIQTEGGNANDEDDSDLMSESSSDESAMERSEPSVASDCSIADSFDESSLNGSDANSFRALNNPRTDQPRVQVAGDEAIGTLQRPANRSEGYRCGCELPLGHSGLCPFNSTQAARREVLEGVVVQPMPLVPDVQRLIQLRAAGNALRQEQDGKYENCGVCGRVTRPHGAVCPFKPCPLCGRRRRDHNNNTFCRNQSKKSSQKDT